MAKGTAKPMRSEIREMRAHKRRIQAAVIIGGAVLAALLVLIFDALISP
jgi:hypothetical protein